MEWGSMFVKVIPLTEVGFVTVKLPKLILLKKPYGSYIVTSHDVEPVVENGM
jgi:hypothetical protein